jgi:4-amino-4-deoxy-L-arabinose transferase-like glycosyltransferase
MPTMPHPRNAPKLPLWLLFPIFFAAVVLAHGTLLHLPYFWDEGGYYIPAALDFFQTGSLIPQSTVTNAHPPLPSILLAGWWHFFGFNVLGTRLLVCLIAAAALLGLYRLCRKLAGETAAIVTTALTAIYPVWFAQSSLAHADIFAAAFTLWALSFYLPSLALTEEDATHHRRNLFLASILFSLAALSKETAIITPLALAAWEAVQFLRSHKKRAHLLSFAALSAPILPLLAWYAYHRHKTGFIFGNPEFLRYNATANLDAYRIVLCLWHRILHLTVHMNMFVPVACTAVVLLIPSTRSRLPKAVNIALGIVLVTNLIEFSILGGALLTRYLLPLYPLILLLCVVEWQRRLPRSGFGWIAIAVLSAAGFLAGIWINPPYAFAPEDNLTYRDMIVLHQQAVTYIEQHYPAATVLTAWPATSELARPEIGYTHHSFHVTPVQNFSIGQMQKAAADPGSFDTALIFSTKWEPPAGKINLGRKNESADTRYFDFHHDLRPAEAAALLHGQVVWQASRRGEWAAVLHFPRIVDAELIPFPTH